jgi:hypothetical protein
MFGEKQLNRLVVGGTLWRRPLGLMDMKEHRENSCPEADFVKSAVHGRAKWVWNQILTDI